MKVAITGVGGAGKSTLCDLIAANSDLPLMRDVMDTWAWARGYKSGKDLADKKGIPGIIDWYIGAMEEKFDLDRKTSRFVADKSLLDHAGRWYGRMFAEATDAQHGRVLELLEQGVQEYDKIVFLPLNPLHIVADNGLRTVNQNHRVKIDLLLRGLADKYAKGKVQVYDFSFGDSPEKVLKDLGITPR